MSDEQLGGLFLGATAALLGPFVWWLTRRAADGRLRRNVWAGIRTAKTLHSDQAWLTGHGAALPWTRRTALVTDTAGVVAVALALSGATRAALVAGLVAIGTLLGGLVLAAIAAHRSLGAADP